MTEKIGAAAWERKAMEYKKYTLYVEPIDGPGMSRTLEIGGNKTLDDLSEAILDAWEFDHSHLYMFSVTRKPYDPDGFYHPSYEERKSAACVSLDSLGLKSRRKILYLYDFGDDWMFYVTVKRVESVEEEPPVRVIQSAGQLEQYPDWDEDDWGGEDWDEEDWDEEDRDEEDWDGEDWVEENRAEEDWDDGGELRIEFEGTPDPVLDSLLEEMPAIYQSVWLQLATEEFGVAGDEEVGLFKEMEKAGLLEMAEIPEGLLLKVKKGTKDPGSYPWIKDLGKRLEKERMLASFTLAYGVIEEEELCRLCSEAGPYGFGPREEFEELAGRMKKHGMFCTAEKDGKSCVSFFPLNVTETVLKQRENYPVKWYREWDDEELSILCEGQWTDAFPVYNQTIAFLAWDCGWDPDDANLFLRMAVLCVAAGWTEDEFFRWVQDGLEENGLRLTKRIRKQLGKFRRQFPSAVLKGYTWEEYEKEKVGDGRQMTLFDEELPFS